MKKVFSIFILCFLFVNLLLAQSSSVNSANRNTALRCLKLAENCLVGNDWKNALRQAELGLSYDENISDLIYLKAAALINMNRSKAEVIKLISSAFEKNDWVGYSKNGARILYADLLSDTGFYDESMKVLDEDSMIYSADAEFIRIKNLYRMSTEASINSARLKLNSARRIYPSDARFPNIFFMFEFVYMIENEKVNKNYEIPEIVKNLSAYYIKKFPDYSGENVQMELLASFFASPEEKVRLVNAIDAKNQTENPVLALAGLDVGLYSDQQAYDLFFEISGNMLTLELLQAFEVRLTDPDVRIQLMERMLNFNGTIFIDENYDLQTELFVEYETGRPVAISYDRNADGAVDLSCNCDFGAPAYVNLEQDDIEIFYDSYPGVSKISYSISGNNYVFNFLQQDFNFSPFIIMKDSSMENLGLDFYIPYINHNFVFPSSSELMAKTVSVELSTKEYDSSKVVYTVSEGSLVSADFYENETKYAYCNITSSFPITRYADYDFDGYYETVELYDSVDVSSDLYDNAEIVKKFGVILDSAPLYLKKICIDRNGNTFYEFTEQYLEGEGKISCWDNNDDGVIDCQYTRFKENDSVLEETVYFDAAGNPEIKLSIIDGVPVKMLHGDSEVLVLAGVTDNLYWIEETGSDSMESAVLEFVKKRIVQGSVDIFELEGQRISVIKIGKSLYCRLLPDSDFIEENEDEAAN